MLLRFAKTIVRALLGLTINVILFGHRFFLSIFAAPSKLTIFEVLLEFLKVDGDFLKFVSVA